jgi:HTH-type transcriptional regulator/antitoxin HigA
MRKLRVLKTEEEYEAALARAYALMDAVPGSPEEDELDLLARLIEAYEQLHFPIDPPDPAELPKFHDD